MPKGVYIRTAKIREGISRGLIGNAHHLGHKHSPETRMKMVLNHKGNIGYHHTDEHKKKMSNLLSGEANGMYGRIGELSPRWQGGYREYSWHFISTLREQIRDRDNHTCQFCGITEAECNRKLDVHHIDFDNKNDDPYNLISLCKSCHGHTQGDRGYWKFYFRKKEGE